MLAGVRAVGHRETVSSTRDEQVSSAYDVSTEGVPPEVTVAVEEVFGWLLADCTCLKRVNDETAGIMRRCGPWSQLYETLTALGQDRVNSKSNITLRVERNVQNEIRTSGHRTEADHPQEKMDEFRGVGVALQEIPHHRFKSRIGEPLARSGVP